MKISEMLKKAFEAAREGMNPSMGLSIEGEMVIKDKDGKIKSKKKIAKRKLFS